MRIIDDTITLILIVAIILFVIGALIAPFESLGRWAGRFGDRAKPTNTRTKTGPQHIVFFVEGIDRFDHDPEESKHLFLQRLRAAYPDLTIISSFFPYAVTNRALHTDRQLSAIRRRLHDSPWAKKIPLVRLALNIRNMYYVAISADSRYGPLQNTGNAQQILQILASHRFDDTHTQSKLTFVTTSGGSQMALGATEYLAPHLRCPIEMIAIGGVMSSSPGLQHITHLANIYSTADSIYKQGRLIFPGRRPIMRRSYRNIARRRGTITTHLLHDIVHNGKNSYFGPANIDTTIKVIVENEML